MHSRLRRYSHRAKLTLLVQAHHIALSKTIEKRAVQHVCRWQLRTHNGKQRYDDDQADAEPHNDLGQWVIALTLHHSSPWRRGTAASTCSSSNTS